MHDERTWEVGWGCKCHRVTFCPDEICIGYEDDVPVYVRRDSKLGRQAIKFQAKKEREREDKVLAEAKAIRARRKTVS